MGVVGLFLLALGWTALKCICWPYEKKLHEPMYIEFSAEEAGLID